MAISTFRFCLPSCAGGGMHFSSTARVSNMVSISGIQQRGFCVWRRHENATTPSHCDRNQHLLMKSGISGFSIGANQLDKKSGSLSMQAAARKNEDCCDPGRLHEHEAQEEDESCFKTASESDLVNILEIIRGKGNWRYQKVKELKALRLKVDPTLVFKVLTQENVSPGLSWKFFVWAKKQMGFKHTSETYNAMLGILCESRKFTSIFFVLEDMHEEGCNLTAETCMKMAKTFGSAGLVERALHALNHMTRLGSPPTAQQYNTLVNALLKNQHFYKAYIAYTEMVRSGCEVDSHTFKLLIRELDRAGKVDLASQLYNEMVAKGCEPDAEISSVLIGVLCKAGRVDDAVLLFERMKNDGIRPNASRYNTLIRYLGKDNKVEKALEIFDELRCHGSLPDNDTLSSLVNALRSEGRDEDADRCCEYSTRSQEDEGAPPVEGDE
ncbi:protein MpPPR_55 [Marchantia polymorpha subsp. ruderalis]|uniref:PROP1-like PPR domain-containing protein n=1 Tax=Marchantia polymorpha TaxID=3197 RepID=A0A2R6W9U3_MARPO|nr:hypothetical protein MARPO_0122s0044 [Marchantia polymorpha]BBN02550.1 hypothetical protein Mp_2g16190 [Marchantia polymorpha subsp. ruderalis]|eukprot:PTQ30618.1 hypothetical protein MARPO_0122s0044 [Marchantia polymorpha]